VRDIIKRIPKMRGHGKNRSRTVNPTIVKPSSINIAALSTSFEAGARVTPNVLVSLGLIHRVGGRTPKVKILGRGAIDKKLTVIGCLVSVAARDAIVRAGGEVL
jgi:large subunit ribosomal protein L15